MQWRKFMDRTTKVLLAAVALGLWANVGVTLLVPAQAQRADNLGIGPLQGIDQNVERLVGAFEKIAVGICSNRKIC
jgi:hypothetical protein